MYVCMRVCVFVRWYGCVCFVILVSIVVSIPACHAGDPGSIPGREAFVQSCFVSCVPLLVRFCLCGYSLFALNSFFYGRRLLVRALFLSLVALALDD